MSNNKTTLSWNNKNVIHQLWTESSGSMTRICLRVVKDVEPELLIVEIPIEQNIVNESWTGEALAVSPAFNDGQLFTQTRVLFNLPQGCVAWCVSHIKLPDNNTMSADKIVFVPGLQAKANCLQAL